MYQAKFKQRDFPWCITICTKQLITSRISNALILPYSKTIQQTYSNIDEKLIQ